MANLENSFSKEEKTYLENNFYFTFSNKKNVQDLLFELKEIKNINILNFLLKLKLTNNKKQNTKILIEKIEQFKNPVKYETLTSIMKECRKLKNFSIEALIPQNLEGEFIELKLKLKNMQDLEKLKKNIDKIYESIENIMQKF